jgi:hypothetical protein
MTVQCVSRCKTRSFWADGVKVRDAEAHLCVDGTWKKVVLTSAGEGEIHVRDIPDGTAVSVGRLALVVRQAEVFGKRGRRRDPREVVSRMEASSRRMEYLTRLLNERCDRAALIAGLSNVWLVDHAQLIRCMQRNPREAYEIMVASQRGNAPFSIDSPGGELSAGWYEAHMEEAMGILLHAETVVEKLVWILETPGTGHAGHALRRLVDLGATQRAAEALMKRAEVGGVDHRVQLLQQDTTWVLQKLGRDTAIRVMRRWFELAAQESQRERIRPNSWGACCQSMLYQLSNATEETVAFSWALEAINTMPEPPEWLVQYHTTVALGNARLQEYRYWSRDLQRKPAMIEALAAVSRDGADRIHHSKGRAQMVRELPDDSPLLGELAKSREVRVQVEALVKLGDRAAWKKASELAQCVQPFAEAMPRDVLLELAAEDTDGVLTEVAIERGLLPLAAIERFSDQRSKAFLARHTTSRDEINAMLARTPATWENQRLRKMLLDRCTDAALAARVGAEQPPAASPLDLPPAPFGTRREHEIRLAELARESFRAGEEIVARAAIAGINDKDLLWFVNEAPGAGTWVAQRLASLHTLVEEPF